MPGYMKYNFPNLTPEATENLFQNDKKLIIIGVIGKSSFRDCNKMAAFRILDTHPALLPHIPEDGQIQFYYKPKDNKLFVHFETTFDGFCAEQIMTKKNEENSSDHHYPHSQRLRTNFGRALLFATHICHLIVFVELNEYFDASMVEIFKALKIIRERHVCKFLPKLLKNSVTGSVLGKQGRLCSPRFLFLFENFPDGYDKSREFVSRLELEVEDNIYKILRNENIITSNRNIGLFSIPANKRYVFYNTNQNLRSDPVVRSLKEIKILLKKNYAKGGDDELEYLRPYPGFGSGLKDSAQSFPGTYDEDSSSDDHKLMNLINEHVDDGFKNAFDDDLTRYKGKLQFTLLNGKTWYEVFKVLHKIFIEHARNPKFEANDPDYKSYLDNFNRLINPDNEFYKTCCEIALKKAYNFYNNPTMTHYSSVVHKKLIEEAVVFYYSIARGPYKHHNEKQLRELCELVWTNGKQQCEESSLRGFPCILQKHDVKDADEHSSGMIFISTCNCGRMQSRREDPYTLKKANYDYYEYMTNNCLLCCKIQKYPFPVFQPSITDYRAAELDVSYEKLLINDLQAYPPFPQAVLSQLSGDSQAFVISQGTQTNLSLASVNDLDKIDMAQNKNSSDEEPVNELVLHLKDEDESVIMSRQASTTEYLGGMVHLDTPSGLLPLFPSWSLCCIGQSSLYSHSTGLQDHFQTGFLSGANFLLPWDVQVRLERPSSWAYDRVRHRRVGEVFLLKIFVGYEYECPRGHRFMMSAPDKILRGASGIQRDSGSKVVFNNMPLYFQCPCRFEKMSVAQLMRIHVVTPKAPVNVIVDPKIKINPYTFTLGLPAPPKLTQSAYWVLRLPYIYQGDEVPIQPPSDILNTNSLNFGYLASGMFGVTETEPE